MSDTNRSAILSATSLLSKAVAELTFSPPVTHVYNPLDYAYEPYTSYLSKYGSTNKRVVFLGMNPGPWGMAQTGVPFGEIDSVRSYLRITGQINKPDHEHPSRPISGFSCSRSEVSGRRLWGLFRERYPNPEDFFCNHFVANYCPLVFMEESGRNRTPDKLSADERKTLFTVCDDYLHQTLLILSPEYVVGVGKFAEKRAKEVVSKYGFGGSVLSILHPSPASPAANRGWAEQATRQLHDSGVW